MIIKAKEINEQYQILRIGYCEAQILLSPLQKVGVTCGVYGWNSDIYFVDDGWFRCVVSTGYRPTGTLTPDIKQLRRYEKLAERYAQKHSLKERANHSKKLIWKLYKRAWVLWKQSQSK